MKLHNELVEAYSIFSSREDRLQKVKHVPGTSLRHSHSSCSPLADPVGGDVPSAVGDVLQSIHEQVASGVHPGGCVVRRLVEGLNLCLQCFPCRKRRWLL
jgi:hypothetical protein